MYKYSAISHEAYRELYRELLKHYYYKNNALPANKEELDIAGALAGLSEEMPKTSSLDLIKTALSRDLVAKAMQSDIDKKGIEAVWSALAAELRKPGSGNILGGKYERNLTDAFEATILPALAAKMKRSFIGNR